MEELNTCISVRDVLFNVHTKCVMFDYKSKNKLLSGVGLMVWTGAWDLRMLSSNPFQLLN